MHVVTVSHRTNYRYANPVRLGEHRLMLRPRAGRGIRVVSSDLLVGHDAQVGTSLDSHGNVVETAAFGPRPTRDLAILSRFRVVHQPRDLEQVAREMRDLGGRVHTRGEVREAAAALRPRRDDPARALHGWVRDCVGEPGDPAEALDAMAELNEGINTSFRYARRDELGTQDPIRTLELGSGTCRDFAFLMVEAARSLGLPARFASGYLYDDSMIDGNADSLVGSGVTHAWAQVFMPGAGWVDFDPTNNLAGGRNLVPSAYVPEPADASPVSGLFTGRPGDFLRMDVSVEVKARPLEPTRRREEASAPGMRTAA